MRQILRRGLILSFGVLFLTAANGIRRDELACEEAFAKIERCCGHPPTQLSCVYQWGCEKPADLPDVSEGLSARLLAMSCDELVDGGWCYTEGDEP